MNREIEKKRKLELKVLEKGMSIPYDLLLLADPAQAVIDEYIGAGQTFLAYHSDERVGVVVLLPLGEGQVEIKNIAVQPNWQGKGIGRSLLQAVIQEVKKSGVEELWIGTGNSSIGQLYLYQSVGFELAEVKWNFFIDHYDEPIWEKGIQCRHMLMLRQVLRRS